MEFYRERIVKNPTKEHTCFFCREPIVGEHYYISLSLDMVFYAYRAHTKCNKLSYKMCSECDWQSGCMQSVEDCFNAKLDELDADWWEAT
jgi:hypothetical protein